MAGTDMPMELLWDVGAKTAVVLALLYGVLWFLRRSWGRSGGARRGPAVQVLQTAHLGPGRAVHILGIGDRTLLVGATSQQISLLAELDSVECEPVAGVEKGQTPFDRYFQQALDTAGSWTSQLKARRDSGKNETGTGTGAQK